MDETRFFNLVYPENLSSLTSANDQKFLVLRSLKNLYTYRGRFNIGWAKLIANTVFFNEMSSPELGLLFTYKDFSCT